MIGVGGECKGVYEHISHWYVVKTRQISCLRNNTRQGQGSMCPQCSVCYLARRRGKVLPDDVIPENLRSTSIIECISADGSAPPASDCAWPEFCEGPPTGKGES